MTKTNKKKSVSYLRRVGWEFDEDHGEWFLWDDTTDFAFMDVDLDTIPYESVKKKSCELKMKIYKESPEQKRQERFLKRIIKQVADPTVPKHVAETRLHFMESQGWVFEEKEKGTWCYLHREDTFLSDKEIYKPYGEQEFRNLVKKKELGL